MSRDTAFVLNPVDAVDLVYRSIRKLEVKPDDHVQDCVDSILSQTVFQLRSQAVVFQPEQWQAYNTLRRYVGA